MNSVHGIYKKEVINICDGSRLGYVSDVIVDSKGCIDSIAVPCGCGILSFFAKGKSLSIAWNDIVKIGEDTILVKVSRDRVIKICEE